VCFVTTEIKPLVPSNAIVLMPTDQQSIISNALKQFNVMVLKTKYSKMLPGAAGEGQRPEPQHECVRSLVFELWVHGLLYLVGIV
jgi:hypothetical protein